MSVGFVPGGPSAPGGAPFSMGEPYSGDPRTAPGLPRPIGWEVRRPDGTAAYLKKGPAATDWISFADLGGGGGGGVSSVNGATGAVVATLASLWSFGVGHARETDNVLPFAGGGFHFSGYNGAGFFPGTAFLESSTSPADSRIGFDYAQRYYRTAVRVGGTMFAEYVGFDPAWGGTFGELQDFSMIDTKIGFSHGTGPNNQPDVEVVLGLLDWTSVVGFFDGPITYPTPGFNSGQREDWRCWLYNDNDASAGGQPRFSLNGYGQIIARTQPRSAGVTSALDVQIEASHWTAAQGNGIGWAIRNGNNDTPLALIDGYQATPTFGQAWGWRLGAWNGSAFGDLLTIDSVNGAVFGVPITSTDPAGVPRMFLTGTIDLTVPGDTVLIPAKPGYTAWLVMERFIVETNGATGVPTASIGNNVTADNVTTSAPMTAAIIGPGTPPYFVPGTILRTNAVPLVDLANPIVLRVSVGATGGPLTGKYSVLAALIPAFPP